MVRLRMRTSELMCGSYCTHTDAQSRQGSVTVAESATLTMLDGHRGAIIFGKPAAATGSQENLRIHKMGKLMMNTPAGEFEPDSCLATQRQSYCQRHR